MSRYRPYPKYKDSGVEWLGKIPEHWEIGLLSNLFTNNKEKNSGMLNNNLLSLSYGKIVNKDIETSFGLLPESFESYQIVHDGYIVLRLTDLQNDQKSLRTGFVTQTGIITSAYVGLKKKSKFIGNEKYFYLYLHTFDIFKGFYGMGSGVRQSLNYDELKKLQFILPPINEQNSIVNFLDNATCKIDTLIQKQQNLIALLKEKRQALISHAVTKGLNPHVKMKDSGVEWLGEVPEHWEVKRIKFLFKIRKRIAGEEGYNVLSITQQGIKIKDIESNEGQLSMDYSKYQFANIGDFAMNHMDLLTGYVDISQFNGVISPDYRVFTLEDKNSFSKFYLYIFQNGYKNKIFYKFGQGSSQLGRWRLPTDEFNDFVFPYPPVQEQQEIANYLENATCKIDTLIAKAQKAIELLKERRTALISATVTGKIDVRSVYE